jgi:hypothetical protein
VIRADIPAHGLLGQNQPDPYGVQVLPEVEPLVRLKL